jgi:hypothetical protein
MRQDIPNLETTLRTGGSGHLGIINHVACLLGCFFIAAALSSVVRLAISTVRFLVEDISSVREICFLLSLVFLGEINLSSLQLSITRLSSRSLGIPYCGSLTSYWRLSRLLDILLGVYVYWPLEPVLWRPQTPRSRSRPKPTIPETNTVSGHVQTSRFAGIKRDVKAIAEIGRDNRFQRQAIKVYNIPSRSTSKF